MKQRQSKQWINSRKILGKADAFERQGNHSAYSSAQYNHVFLHMNNSTDARVSRLPYGANGNKDDGTGPREQAGLSACV